MKTLLTLILLLIPLFYGCHQRKLGGNEFIKYIENEKHGLNKIKQIEDLLFQMQYCPTEYMLLKEYKTDILSDQVVKERLKNNENMLFYKLRISAKGSNDVINYKLTQGEDYYARIQYLSYGFEENIALVNDQDTIFPALFHFERTYGVVPYIDFMMAFESPLKSKAVQVLLDDKVFNTGILKFTYSIDDIDNIPELKTN